MIRKEVIDYISRTAKVPQTDLIEKDILLHILLSELTKDPDFKENYCFKGGTCLIKCYFGHYRFSEDLDFSFIQQGIFKNKSEKEIRQIISSRLLNILTLLKICSEKFDMTFEADKKNSKYTEFGGSNKFATFKLWYNSVILDREQFIKIQINFVEQFVHKLETRQAKALSDLSKDKEFKFLFPEYLVLAQKPMMKAYSLDEIMIEKIRALLTRKGLKTRDAIDIFLILQKQKGNLKSYEADALKKTRFMLKYEKYRQNLKEKTFDGLFSKSEEERLLIKHIDSEKLPSFQKELVGFLEKLKEKLI